MRVFFLSFLLILVSCKVTYPTIDLDSISDIEKKKVYDFGKRIVETCKTRQFVQLSQKEVTKNLLDLSLPEMQHFCDVIDKRNGKFMDMKLIEVIDDTFKGSCKIFRYKANFERNEFQNEIRIWLKNDGKIAGIICREWNDNYLP